MMKKSLWFAAFAAVVLAAGCANLKEPATKAVNDVEAQITALASDGSKMLPEEFSAAQTSLDSLKSKLAAGDYKGVMADVPALTSQVSSLKSALDAKRAELAAAAEKARADWAGFSSDLPKMVSAIQSRVDILSKSKHLPKNLDKAAFDAAKTGLDGLKQGWTEAMGEFNAGNFTAAATKAAALKDKAAEVMKQLGMTSG
jgi:outer membrane murein-binding lipoprotein Lpp